MTKSFDEFINRIYSAEIENEWREEDRSFKKKRSGVVYSSPIPIDPHRCDEERRILFVLKKYHEWANGGSE